VEAGLSLAPLFFAMGFYLAVGMKIFTTEDTELTENSKVSL